MRRPARRPRCLRKPPKSPLQGEVASRAMTEGCPTLPSVDTPPSAADAAATSPAGGGMERNLLALAVEAARARATLGEISAALEDVFGRYGTQPTPVSGIYGGAYAEDERWARLIRGVERSSAVSVASPGCSSPRWARTGMTGARTSSPRCSAISVSRWWRAHSSRRRRKPRNRAGPRRRCRRRLQPGGGAQDTDPRTHRPPARRRPRRYQGHRGWRYSRTGLSGALRCRGAGDFRPRHQSCESGRGCAEAAGP